VHLVKYLNLTDTTLFLLHETRAVKALIF